MYRRKDFTKLIPSERTDLANALNRLWNDGTIRRYVDDHRAFARRVHRGSIFLPWHRYFVWRFELALGVPIPFWDWTQSRSLDVEPWLSFFGGRSGKGRLAWPPRRASTPGAVLPDQRALRNALDKPSFTTFRNIETASHNAGHNWVGGDMADVDNSPIDPLFYLHHCNIDRLWAIWEQNHPDAKHYSTTRIPGDRADGAATLAVTTPMPCVWKSPPKAPRSMLDHTELDYWYDRDLPLEKDWHAAKKLTGLWTGIPGGANLLIRDSDTDAGRHQGVEKHWASPDIWVRNNEPEEGASNTSSDHERPIVNRQNHMYVNVRNEGSETADDVSVTAYRCDPATTMLWPNDFTKFGDLSVLGSIPAGQSTAVGPFSWTPAIAEHEWLLAVADCPDDPSMAPMFRVAVPHGRLVRFDSTVGQRNVMPIQVALDGTAPASMGMRGGIQPTTNGLRLDAGLLPRNAALSVRVPLSMVADTELTNLREMTRDACLATLRMNGGEVASIDGFQMAARARSTVRLKVWFPATAKHGERYPLVATQTQDGELAGRITIELVAVDDRQSREGEVHGNTRSKEVHTADCVFWGKVNPRNKVPFGSLAEGLANGYDGCRFCLDRYDTG